MFQTISVAKLNESAVNPRFELTNLKELAASIREHGIIEPVIVRKDAGAKETYTIIAGHRRVAAATMAGLKEVPAVINEIDAPNAHLHLIENIQREQLSHIEIATAIYEQIIGGTKSTDLADSLGKPRSWISKYKTIGEAMTKLVDENKSVEKLVLIENINKLYEEALKVLGKNKEKTTKTTPPVTTDDDAHDMDGLTDGEIAVLEELSALALEAFKGQKCTVNVLPHGNTGFEVKLVFKDETAVRKYIQINHACDDVFRRTHAE